MRQLLKKLEEAGIKVYKTEEATFETDASVYLTEDKSIHIQIDQDGSLILCEWDGEGLIQNEYKNLMVLFNKIKKLIREKQN